MLYATPALCICYRTHLPYALGRPTSYPLSTLAPCLSRGCWHARDCNLGFFNSNLMHHPLRFWQICPIPALVVVLVLEALVLEVLVLEDMP